jgi:hypothetical protein
VYSVVYVKLSPASFVMRALKFALKDFIAWTRSFCHMPVALALIVPPGPVVPEFEKVDEIASVE